MQTRRDLLRICAKSVVLSAVLWLLFLAVAARFGWPLYAGMFTIIWIIPLTIAGSVALTASERFLVILGVSVTLVILTFAAMPLLYPNSAWTVRGLLGALVLGALIGILSTFIVPRFGGSGVRR